VLACPHGHIRVFADAGAPMRALLGQLAAGQAGEDAAARAVPSGYLAAVLRAAAGHPHPGPRPGGGAAATPRPGRGAPAALPRLPEPLTPRERDVLRLLAAGRSNQRIAHEFVLTLDTVKKHVSHLLGKLGAANRTEAVTRARELGLIP
jgi:LuxR family maltose regulon positive regulatory protein